VANDDVIESPTHIWTRPRISNAPAIMQTRDPTAKCNLITTARIHRRQSRNNTLGALPKIIRTELALIQPERPTPKKTRQSSRVRDNTSPVIIIPPYRMLGGGTRASARLISQRALTAMTLQEALVPFQEPSRHKNSYHLHTLKASTMHTLQRQ
jgi:hypothetical protein